MKRAYFEEMLDDVVAGEMAESGQLGVARQMATQMHPKEASVVPTSGIATAPEVHLGLPVRSRSAGKGIPELEAPNLPIPAHAAGISLNAAAKSGPVPAKVHESYRLNQ